MGSGKWNWEKVIGNFDLQKLEIFEANRNYTNNDLVELTFTINRILGKPFVLLLPKLKLVRNFYVV